MQKAHPADLFVFAFLRCFLGKLCTGDQTDTQRKHIQQVFQVRNFFNKDDIDHNIS